MLMFASQVVTARCLTLHGFGVFSYASSLVAIASVIIVWGTDRYCLKVISTESVAESPIQFALRPVAILLTINSVLVCSALTWLFYTAGQLSMVATGGAVVALALKAYLQVSSAVTKGVNRVIEAEVCTGILRPLIYVIPLSAFLFLRGDSEFIAVGSILWMLAASFLGSLLISVNSNFREDRLAVARDGVTTGSTLHKASFLFFVLSIGPPLMANISMLSLAYFRHPEEVALFAAANKMVSLVILALVSANQLIAPQISPLFRAGKLDDLRNLLQRNNSFVVALTILPIVLILAQPRFVLGFFPEEYLAADYALQGLVIGQAFSVACGPVVVTCTMCGFQKAASVAVLTACLINVVLCLVLVPSLGAYGAVVGTVMTHVVRNAFLAVHIYRRTGLNVTVLNLLPVLAK